MKPYEALRSVMARVGIKIEVKREPGTYITEYLNLRQRKDALDLRYRNVVSEAQNVFRRVQGLESQMQDVVNAKNELQALVNDYDSWGLRAMVFFENYFPQLIRQVERVEDVAKASTSRK